MTQTVLIDGDIVAYKAAARNEETFDFGDGGTAEALNPARAREQVFEIVEEIRQSTGCERTLVCLSDPKKNWRKRLDPTYKGQREGRKPALLMPIKELMWEEFGSSAVDWLEADDVMGIKASRDPDTYVIASEDKDMRTIPARVFNPGKSDQGVQRITRREADEMHLWQTLTGDVTDNYKGCPGIGKKSEFVEWMLDEDDPLEKWMVVVAAYRSKGLTEKDAIHQARLARICRFTDWDAERGRVQLWNPTFLLH